MANKTPSKFLDFLTTNGADVLEPTSTWEVARWSTTQGIFVVYRNKKWRVSFSSKEAEQAWEAFQNNKPWSANPPLRRVKKKSVEDLIIDRDGKECFYCGTTDFSAKGREITVEHFLSISQGGNNNIANLAIACANCNEAVGSLPIVEKIRFRDLIRESANPVKSGHDSTDTTDRHAHSEFDRIPGSADSRTHEG